MFRHHTITFEAALRDLGSRRAETRIAAAAALGHLPADVDAAEATRALRAAAADPDPKVRAAVAWSLGENRAGVDTVIALLADPDPAVGAAAAAALSHFGRLAFDVLEQALVTGAPQVRYQAAYSLADVDPERAFLPLVNRLGDADGEVRAGVARALAHAGDRRAADWLCPVLEDGADNARFEAALAMVHLGDARGLPALVEFLDDDGRAWEAIEAMEALGNRAAAPALEGMLRRGPKLLRVRAARALVALSPGHLEALRTLERARRSWRADVRGLAQAADRA